MGRFLGLRVVAAGGFWALALAVPGAAQVVLPETQVIAPAGDAAAVRGTLPMFTPVKLMLDEELLSQTATVGQPFTVTVLEDVVAEGTVVIPAGTKGRGEVTFAAAKGGLGRPGILQISLRQLDLGGTSYILDGRYREEGKSKSGAVAATWFAVGIFSAFIKGEAGKIDKGRELRGRTGEAIPFTIGADAPSPLAPGASDAAAAPQDTAIVAGSQTPASETSGAGIAPDQLHTGG